MFWVNTESVLCEHMMRSLWILDVSCVDNVVEWLDYKENIAIILLIVIYLILLGEVFSKS